MREIYFVLLVLDMALVLVGMFWLNEAVFLIAGYDPELAGGTTTASVEMFRDAAQAKLPFLIVVNLLSISLLGWTIKSKPLRSKAAYSLLLLINIALTLSALTLVLLYLLLPGRLL